VRARFQIPIVGGAVLLALLLLRVWDPAVLQVARHRVFDIFQRAAPRVALDAPVVIVAIDEASLAAYGQWPWPRTVFADLAEALTRAGAAAIASEVVWAEPDRTSPENIVHVLRDLDPVVADGLRAMRSNDAVLAKAMRGARFVLGQSPATGPGTVASSGPKGTLSFKGSDPTALLPRVSGWATNLGALEDAAAGIGALTLQVDADGVLRRPALLVGSEAGTYPVLALEALRVALSQPGVVSFGDRRGMAAIRVGPLLVPTDRRGRAWLPFGPHRAEWFVSAADVLARKVPPAAVKGKIVFVGLAASGLQRSLPTPIADLTTTEIQAQLAAAMIKGTMLVRPLWSDAAEQGAIAVAGAAVIAGVTLFGALVGFAFVILGAGTVLGASWALFAQQGLLVDGSLPAAATVLLYAALVAVGYARERRQRQEVRGAFAHYLSPALVERLADNPGALRIGGEMKTMTMLFCDIRGFTGIAERFNQDPEGLTRLINLYFTAMSDRLLEYGATIDKYMGDAVMAFWNAPLDDPDHARNACRAALEMLDGLAKLNHKLAAAGTDIAIDIGIGLNSGPCLVGNVGSEHRFNYSVIGDAVNLAARLESETKLVGARIIVGEATRALAPDFAYLELGRIRARGRSEVTTIHALLGPPEMASREDFRRVADEQGRFLAAYHGRDWASARAVLAASGAAKEIAPAAFNGDRLRAFYAERIGTWEQTPPPADWDGTPEG
jgi:adenylate cyclase